ncbi:MAG TPA: diguanylate cyclase, partial [Gallionellaceae bacterium]|nr:diguanylate cyclase [Gallionellaceae bacterium]
MAKQKIIFYGGILLITAEVSLISFLGYAVNNYLPIEMAHYISIDVLYCLPILQTARLAAIHATRRSDTQTTTFVAVAVALVWSATEASLTWEYFPVHAFILNTFTRSVVFTVIGRVVVKLWREREYGRKDMLTGLANRVELLERLEAEQGRSERSGRAYSLLFIDIDHFKVLNDIHGHRVGDEALKLLANILNESCRKVDVVARLGGDEFVLLLPDTDEKSCDILVKRIDISTKRAFEGRFWPISVSIGRVTGTGRTQKADWIIRLADENMYEIKQMKQKMMNG